MDGGGLLKPIQVVCLSTTTKHRKKKNSEEIFVESEYLSESDNGTEWTILANDMPSDGLFVKGFTEPGAIRRVLGI